MFGAKVCLSRIPEIHLSLSFFCIYFSYRIAYTFTVILAQVKWTTRAVIIYWSCDLIFHNNKAIQCRFTTWVSLLFVAIFLQLLNMIRPKQVFNPFIAVYADSAWIEKIIRCICWYFEWNGDRIWVCVIINQAGIRNYNSWLSPLILKCVIFLNGRIFMTVFQKEHVTFHVELLNEAQQLIYS